MPMHQCVNGWEKEGERVSSFLFFLSFSSFLLPLPLPLPLSSAPPAAARERRLTCSLGLGLPLGKQKKARNQSELEEGSDSNHNRYRSSYHCVAREKLHLAIWYTQRGSGVARGLFEKAVFANRPANQMVGMIIEQDYCATFLPHHHFFACMQ